MDVRDAAAGSTMVFEGHNQISFLIASEHPCTQAQLKRTDFKSLAPAAGVYYEITIEDPDVARGTVSVTARMLRLNRVAGLVAERAYCVVRDEGHQRSSSPLTILQLRNTSARFGVTRDGLFVYTRQNASARRSAKLSVQLRLKPDSS
jgi:hypothetical protein